MKKSKRNKLIDQLCSLGAAVTMIITMLLVIKYHYNWKMVMVTMLPFLFGLVLIVFVITRVIKARKIAKAMVTEDYDTMSGEDFEEFCANILRGNGFINVEVTKASGDHGIDVLGTKDGLKYAIQCKRYSRPVGNKAVQEAYSGKDIYKADVAVVMSNMDFTPQAIEDARKLKVELWNRDKIYSLQKKGKVETPEPSEENDLICPKCGATLVLRTAKKGVNAGSQFYGCSNYPNCKYTRNL